MWTARVALQERTSTTRYRKNDTRDFKTFAAEFTQLRLTLILLPSPSRRGSSDYKVRLGEMNRRETCFDMSPAFSWGSIALWTSPKPFPSVPFGKGMKIRWSTRVFREFVCPLPREIKPQPPTSARQPINQNRCSLSQHRQRI